MDAVQHVRHALRRVVDVALEVDERRLLLEHARLVALGDGVDDVVHVGVALADVHIVADADDVRHERDHVRGLAHRFAVRDLALALVEVLHLKPEKVARRRKAEARAGGVVTEQRDAESGIEDLAGDVVLTQVTQRVRHGKHRRDLVVGLFPGQEKVAVVHVVELELVQLVGVFLDVAHNSSSVVCKLGVGSARAVFGHVVRAVFGLIAHRDRGIQRRAGHEVLLPCDFVRRVRLRFRARAEPYARDAVASLDTDAVCRERPFVDQRTIP